MRRYQEGGLARMTQTMVHPEDVNLPVDQQRLVFGQMSERGLTPVTGPQGGMLDAARAAALLTATGMTGAVSDRDLSRLQQIMAARQQRDPAIGAAISLQTGTSPKTVARQLMRSGHDRDEIEIIMEDANLQTGGTGGRIVEHANNALEWVPHFEGVPQPPIGDVFYDPIKEHERKLEREQMMEQIRQGNVPQMSPQDKAKLARGGRT